MNIYYSNCNIGCVKMLSPGASQKFIQAVPLATAIRPTRLIESFYKLRCTEQICDYPGVDIFYLVGEMGGE